jgi:hypothetical protein
MNVMIFIESYLIILTHLYGRLVDAQTHSISSPWRNTKFLAKLSPLNCRATLDNQLRYGAPIDALGFQQCLLQAM